MKVPEGVYKQIVHVSKAPRLYLTFEGGQLLCLALSGALHTVFQSSVSLVEMGHWAG